MAIAMNSKCGEIPIMPLDISRVIIEIVKKKPTPAKVLGTEISEWTDRNKICEMHKQYIEDQLDKIVGLLLDCGIIDLDDNDNAFFVGWDDIPVSEEEIENLMLSILGTEEKDATQLSQELMAFLVKKVGIQDAHRLSLVVSSVLRKIVEEKKVKVSVVGTVQLYSLVD